MKFSYKLIEFLLILLQSKISLCFKIQQLIQNALFIADSTFEHNFATSIVWFPLTSDVQKVTEFLKNYNGSVVLTPIQNGNDEEIHNHNRKNGYQQTVFFAADITDFAKFMELLKPDKLYPIRLILVLTELTSDDELSAITKTARENDLADIVIISADQEENIKQTTFYPYNTEICGDHSPVQIKPDVKNWFPKKFYNFRGCPIKVALLHLIPYNNLTVVNGTVQSMTGLDGIFFDMLIKKMNARMDYVLCKGHGDFGSVFSNGSSTGCYVYLFENHVDIISPAIVIDPLKSELMQMSPVFESLAVSWFGPPRRQREQWLKILQPFLTDTSKGILISFLIFIFVTTIVHRYGHHRVKFRLSVTFQTFIMFLGQEVKFESVSWLLNSLFMKWIWFCMIVRFVYQGDLVDGLQKNVLEKPLTEIRDAVKEVDGYGGLEFIQEIYEGTAYHDKFESLGFPMIRKNVEEISNGKRYLLASAQMLALELGRGLQMLDEPITRSPMSFLMRRGWPASRNIDTAILGLAQGGFIENILSNSRYNLTRKEEQFEDREARPLNMGTLIGCFYGLAVLYLICISVFIGELVYYKHKMKSQNILQ